MLCQCCYNFLWFNLPVYNLRLPVEFKVFPWPILVHCSTAGDDSWRQFWWMKPQWNPHNWCIVWSLLSARLFVNSFSIPRIRLFDWSLALRLSVTTVRPTDTSQKLYKNNYSWKIVWVQSESITHWPLLSPLYLCDQHVTEHVINLLWFRCQCVSLCFIYFQFFMYSF